MRKLQACCCVGMLLGAGACLRAVAEPAAELSDVVVTATRIEQSSFDLPVSIDRVDRAEIQNGQLQVNLSESLMTVPGVSAQNRQNYAQDLQVSVRGFGARSSFGVSGVRLYSDGIPGNTPDGQGQFSQFDLGSADHIEVLRGPFSALYGNSSGGVIAIFTEDGKPGVAGGVTAEAGSFDLERYELQVSGGEGSVNYLADASHFQTNGYRDHSAAERNNLNVKVNDQLSEDSKLTVIANMVQTPSVQDPLGLTEAQLLADPAQAGSNAIAFNTRKSVSQEQLGVIYDQRLAPADDLVASAYAGHRDTTQFQAIPLSTEKVLTSPGGVIALSRNFWGADLHVEDRRTLAGTPLVTTAGVNYDDLEEARDGYLNYVGAVLGVEGALRRDEANHVYDANEYLQTQWDPGARWRILAGVRNNVVVVSDHDHLADSGPPDSSVRYTAVDPVAGVTFRASNAANVYASYGKGFETPTLDELAYRSTNGSLPGLNLGLEPARSNNFEVGLKTQAGRWRADLAAFYIKTEDELAVEANSGGRSVYENIGETNRRGLEFEADGDWPHGFSARLAYTYIRAVVGQAYATCLAVPCKTATSAGVIVPAGSHLTAVPMNSLYAGLTWSEAASGFTATVETIGRAQIYANDLNSAAAPGYWVANLHAGFVQQLERWRLSEYLRLDNVAGRRYVGSVIVNSTNFGYFEPEPGRAAYLMFNAAFKD